MFLGEFVLWLFTPLSYLWGVGTDFFQIDGTRQTLFWLVVVCADLSMVLILYRFFGKVGLYGAVVLDIMLCNIMGPKITAVMGFNTTMGAILYAGIYFATDLLGERYGRREANRAVLLGFATGVMVVVLTQMSLVFLPTQAGSENEMNLARTTHDAQLALFTLTPTVFIASLSAYLVSQLHDVWMFHLIKRKTKGKHLWLRNNVSTMISQAIDTIIFAMIGWVGMLNFDEAIRIGLAVYMFKVIIALIDTPFIYLARTWDVHRKDWHYGAHDAPEEHLVALRPQTEES